MANVISLNQIQAVMADIAIRHYSINTFVCSPIWDYDSVKNLTFPVLHMRPVSGLYERSNDASSYPVKELNIEIRVLDLVEKGKENRDDVNSDTEQMLSDVVQEMNEHPYYQRSNLQIVGDVNLTFLDEISDTEVNGVMAEFTLRMKNQTSFCGLPFTTIPGYSFPGYSSEASYANVQYLTCETVTACTTFQNYVQNALDGAVGFTGGTVAGPSVFTGGFSANTLYSGSTNLYDIFLTTNDGNDITRVGNGLNTYTGGTANNPTVNVSALTINNLTVSGSTSLGIVSATTIYSGSTNLYDIFITTNDGNDITRVQSGTNITTGGTANEPTVNLNNNISLNSVSGNSISASTIYSGSTNLYDIFITTNDGNDITRVQNGLNTYTGGTANEPTVNVSGLTIDNLTVSGATSITTLSAGTIYSGSTNLYDIFITTNDGNDITRVQNGLNTYTGGTANEPTVNLNDNISLNSVSGNSISASTIYSGSTNLYDIFITTNDGNDITRVQNGLNTYTGGTPNNPTVNMSAATLTYLSAVTISGGTIYSGGTDLSNLFLTTNDGNDITRLGNGLNTYTGGTANEPTVNVSGLTIDNITVSGSTSLGIVSATTIYSGSTNLYDIFLTTNDGNDITRVQNGLNTYTGGTANEPTVNVSGLTINNLSVSGGTSITTLSAGTIFSGSTNLYDIFITTNDGNDITRVQNGLNTYTGGTANEPTVNVSALTIDNLTVSGSSSFASLSATTFYSGSTDISLLIPQPSTSGNLWAASTGANSIIANNGTGNLASGSFSFAGGRANTASGTYSIAGGRQNTASGNHSFVGGGQSNSASGTWSSVGGGFENSSIGNYSFLGGGTHNVLGASGSATGNVIGGGRRNTIYTINGFIGGGSGNTVTGGHSSIGGGQSHVITGAHSSIGGGQNHIISGTHSLIGGGYRNTLSGIRSAIIGGQNITGAQDDTVYMPNGRAISSFSATTYYSGSTEISTLFSSNQRIFGITIDGGGSVPTTGGKGYVVIPFNGTLTKWNILSDVSGSTVIDIKRLGTSIIGGGGNKPTLSSMQQNVETVSGWASDSIMQDDVLEFNLDSVTTCTRINLFIYITEI